MSTIVIETKSLTKVYGSGNKGFKALDQLNLTVNQGEIFGYLGPNGAGKTTTIRMLLDLIRPTAGVATILGMDTQKNSVELHRKIGFLPGELGLWKNEKSMDIIRYVARIRGGADMGYVNELVERFQFDVNKKVREYSSGNKRKLGVILALMNKPELLILDEPTGGLDPLMQQTFNQLMMDVKNEGRTVFLSSHVLSEVQAICDRVGILRGGQLKAVESIEKLTHVDFRWLTIQFREGVPDKQRLEALAGVSDVEVNGSTAKLRLMGDIDPLLRAINDHYIIDLRAKDPSLEEIFLAFYDDESSVVANKQFSRNNHTQKERV